MSLNRLKNSHREIRLIVWQNENKVFLAVLNYFLIHLSILFIQTLIDKH